MRAAWLAGLFLSLGLIGQARAAGIERLGPPEKICQLTGETDWQTGQPTAAKTFSRYGLEAADLGYPVEHQGKLILLFGDSWPTLQPPGALVETPPNDAVGIVTAHTPPSATQCLGMRIQDQPGLTMRVNGTGEAMKIYAPATVTGPARIDQGFFDVPSGGVSVGDGLYGFFWTAHCAKGHAIDASPEHPLARPAGDERCPESDARNSIGHGVMARSEDDGRTFQHASDLPPGFVYTIGVNAAVEGAGGHEIFIFGAPRYRASVPYLAKATPKTFSNPASWQFFAGRGNGQPQWIGARQWSAGYSQAAPASWRPPSAAEIFPEDAGDEACVGEFSVTWNRPLRQWLMLYNCKKGIEARIAPQPWGPWSKPALLLGAADNVRCRWVMAPAGCGARRDFWPTRRQGKDIVSGGFYAPFVLNRYTQGGAPDQAVIYWLVSTWNPYEVMVMRTTLQSRPD